MATKFGTKWVKVPVFPLTLLVIVTTVLRYRAACDKHETWVSGGANWRKGETPGYLPCTSTRSAVCAVRGAVFRDIGFPWTDALQSLGYSWVAVSPGIHRPPLGVLISVSVTIRYRTIFEFWSRNLRIKLYFSTQNFIKYGAPFGLVYTANFICHWNWKMNSEKLLSISHFSLPHENGKWK